MTATLTTLVNFSGSNGASPYGGLIEDATGNLFGTTSGGGTFNSGTVFEIVYDSGTASYASTPTTLVSFDGLNGATPIGGLIADAAGNLFGTTSGGGTSNSGTVFEIVYDFGTVSYASTPTTLVNFNGSFNGSNGANPRGGLIADAAGDLFGTTNVGGTSNSGTVFEIAYHSATASYASIPTTLVSFTGLNGTDPQDSLIADAAGNLFGTTAGGGTALGYGTVFKIAYNSATASYASNPTTLVSFDGSNGATPNAGLIADAAGNLFGTTTGGGTFGSGTVFEIVYDSGTASYAATPTTLVSFNGSNGADPEGGLIADAAGDLFGTTYAGGTSGGHGTVFEIAYDSVTTSYASIPTTLVSFKDSNGANPTHSLIADAAGNLFSTTSSGGTSGNGTAFEISGVDQISCYVAGTLIETVPGPRRVETLVVGDEVRTLLGGPGRIVWVGARTVDCARHPRPGSVWPVLIEAEAFADGTSSRDLLVSPDHALYIDGVLIPAKLLVNGTTIRQVKVGRVVYHHIELARHDVVLAEGLPAETYLDTGDRATFAGGAVTALYPDFAARTWEMEGCAPLVLTGDRLEAVRRKVARVRHQRVVLRKGT